MGGGLIQLITTGIQDSPLIGNPEITFFKTVYKQHTLFSICQSDRFLGSVQFGKGGNKIIEKNGDLLYNNYFKLEIPYFEIIKSTTQEYIYNEYNINELSITYMNKKCYVINFNNTWYIIPEQLFKLGNFTKTLTQISPDEIIDVLLPEYINSTDLGNNIYYYSIEDNSISPIITLLRLESNYWEQFWLDIIATSHEDILLDSLQTLKNNYNNLYELIRYRLFYLYNERNSHYKNTNYLSFYQSSNSKDAGNNIIYKTELERYIEYINNFDTAIKTIDTYEIDTIYTYCIQNFKNFDDYKTDYLKYTPLIILFIYKMLYSDNKIIFTFWKKFSVLENNNINENINITNVHNETEWENNINFLINEILSNNNIKSIILDELKNKYYILEDYIVNLFSNLHFQNPKDIYIKLKIYLSRFYSVPTMQLNFAEYYMPYKYDDPILYYTTINDSYNNDLYNTYLINETTNYPNLNNIIDKLSTNEMDNLTPVNLENIYAVIADDVLTISLKITLINNAIKSFIIFWRNLVIDRLYKKFIDNYSRTIVNPKFVDSPIRNLSYYFTFNPGNMITSDEIRNSWIRMFYRDSWLGSACIDNNAFLKCKENMYDVEIKTLATDFTNINQNKDFNHLEITNTYNYIYYNSVEKTDNYNRYNLLDVIFDSTTKKLYIRYDNYYDPDKITIVLSYTKYNRTEIIPLSFNTINYEMKINELKVNSIYLVFTLNNTYTFSNGDNIKLTAYYSNHVPLLNFYKTGITKPYIKTNKYVLLSKNSDNQLDICNITKLDASIDDYSTLYDSIIFNGINSTVSNNKLKILVINYLNNSLLVKPTNFFTVTSNITRQILLGTYLYAVSYYTLTNESDLSNYKEYTSTTLICVDIKNIPISNNKNIIGRNIYRTKANLTTFYLLTKINDNITTSFIDTIYDNDLGVEYTSDNNIKLNELPNITTTVVKKIVNINIDGSNPNRYYLSDSNNPVLMPPYNLPQPINIVSGNYDNIYEIYIEEYDFTYTIYKTPDYSISNKGQIQIPTYIFNSSTPKLHYLFNKYNYMDNIKLVPYYSKYTETLTPTIVTNVNSNSNSLSVGFYTYKISLYSSTTTNETTILYSDTGRNIIDARKYVLFTFGAINNKEYDCWRIYRSKVMNPSIPAPVVYLLTTVNSIYGNTFSDNIPDIILTQKYIDPFFYITKPINTSSINRPHSILYIIPYTNTVATFQGKYKYQITYRGTYNGITEETIACDPVFYTNNANTSIYLRLPMSTNRNVTQIGIYRSRKITDDTLANPCYFVNYKTYNYTDTICEYIDATVDGNLDATKIAPTINNTYGSYYILEIPLNDITPNLNDFISHSTDYKCMNNKNISDMNDFIFNEPSIMLINATNSTITSKIKNDMIYTNPIFYFYNIDFRINSTSTITLNKNKIIYIMPLSTQQFFIKPSVETYYTINKNNYIISSVNDAIINQKTFNPAFDEFNTSNIILSNYYYYTLIDNIIDIYDNIILGNTDYISITNIIESINNKYIDTFTNLLNINNDYYGFLSKEIINNVSLVNKYLNLFRYENYRLTTSLNNYSHSDFVWYLNNNLRLYDYDINYEKGALSIITYLDAIKTTLKILSPIFKTYISRDRLSDNVILYLTNVSELFTNHLEYINNNIDYLNLSNSNNYKNDYLSISEINQNINNKYYYYSEINSTTITTLFPIIDTLSTIYKINITDQYNNIKTINTNEFTLIDSYNISTTNYIDNKLEDKYINSELLINESDLITNTKFNYYGISYINSTSEFNFNDTYIVTDGSTQLFKLDDNNIYSATHTAGIGKPSRYNFTNTLSILNPMSDCLVVNPYKITLSNTTIGPFTINGLPNNFHCYKILLLFNASPTVNMNANSFIIGPIGIDRHLGYLSSITADNKQMYLYLLTKTNISQYLNFTNLIYLTNVDDITTVNVISTPITTIRIIKYKHATHYLPYTNEIDLSSDIFKYNNNYYSFTDVLLINMNLNGQTGNMFYFTLEDGKGVTGTITVYKNVIYNLQPSMNIINYYAYSNYEVSDYTKVILDTNDTHFILLVDIVLNRHFMMRKQNIRTCNIPKGNYHTWILPQDNLRLIPYDITYSVNQFGDIINLQLNKIPEYYYYMVVNGLSYAIYYYETGTTVNTNINTVISYYNGVINTNYTKIYLIDNTLFNINNKQLIKSYKITRGYENYITKNIIRDKTLDGTQIIDVIDDTGDYVGPSITKNYTPIYDFDTLLNYSYKSDFTQEIFTINSYNNDIINLNFSNIITEQIVLQSNADTTKKLYFPLILKKYISTAGTSPVISFTISGITYRSSYIPIYKPDWAIDQIIGQIQSTKPLISTIDLITLTLQAGTTYIYNIKLTANIIPYYFKFIVYKLLTNVVGEPSLEIYFWIFVSNTQSIIDKYLTVVNTLSFSQPVYTDINGNITISNILTNYTLLNSNIFIKDGNHLKLNILANAVKKICYKYYSDTRHTDTTNYNHEILPLNFNSLLNIKPSVLLYANSKSNIYPVNDTTYPHNNIQTIFNTAAFFVFTTTDLLTGDNKYYIVPKTTAFDITNIYSLSNINNISLTLSTYFSLQNPIFVKNSICLVPISDTLYTIATYDKLYLEQDEIVCINLHFFIVKGLNHFNNTYELEPIRHYNNLTFGTNLQFTNIGYYTYGVYTKKLNKELPNFIKQNIIQFTTNTNINLYDIYLYNNILNINTDPTVLNNNNLYGNFKESCLNVKLLYNNAKFYLFDNFVKLKIYDKILYLKSDNTILILNIKNIRDNEILFDLTNVTLPTFTDNTFYSFILPYQPFEIKYIQFEISTGNVITIQNTQIQNNAKILIPNTNNTQFDIYSVLFNSTTIPVLPTYNTIDNKKYMWCLVWNTIYASNFNNPMKIPILYTTPTNYSSLTNKFPIILNATYESATKRLKINNLNKNTNIINGFTFFYNQPIKMFGLYNYIKNITYSVADSSYYIYITNEFTNNSDFNLKTIDIIISPSNINETDLYYLTKFRYNYGIQLLDYDMVVGTQIEVIRVALKNDQLIFIEKTRNNNKIIFKYGYSQAYNEVINNITSDTYTNIYFYNYCMINTDGTINNFDTLFGTYFLLCEKNTNDIQRIHLCKIKEGNKIKVYTSLASISSNSLTLNKLIWVKINENGTFTYGNNQIAQVVPLVKNNTQPIEIIIKYPIKFINEQKFSSGKYNQDITFISNIVDTNIYNTVYLDEKLTQECIIIYTNPTYTLQSNKYITHNVNIIYTKNVNYLVKSLQINKQLNQNKKLNDNTLEFYINTKIINTEDIVQNILVSKISKTTSEYKHKLLDNTHLSLNINEKYTIQDTNLSISSFNNNDNTIITINNIDNDNLEISNDYSQVQLFTNYEIDISNIFHQSYLFTDVYQLKQDLFNKSYIDANTLMGYLKPWKDTSIVASAQYTTSLQKLLNRVYIQYLNGVANVIATTDDTTYSLLTNNEIDMLKKFIVTINSANANYRANYLIMINNIDLFIYGNRYLWLAQPDFFLDVINNINNTFKNNNIAATFDGNNIIFDNDPNPPYITIDGEQEIAYYLPYGYTYDNIQNIVYKPTATFNNIVSDFRKWINKTNVFDGYGLSVNKTLRYLRILGDQFRELYTNFTNPLTDTPDYFYNSPLKFIIGRLWEKYSNTSNLSNLDKEFTDNLTIVSQFEINKNKVYSYIQFDETINISYYGLVNYAKALDWITTGITDVNINDILELEPYGSNIVNVINTLEINPIYKYKLSVNNEININSNYSFDFLYGNNLSNQIKISNIEIYPDEINFESDYNIKPTDFFVLIQETEYTIIKSTYLGYLYNITFNVNTTFIEQLYFQGSDLLIIKNEPNKVTVLLSINNLNTNNAFEFKNRSYVQSFTKTAATEWTIVFKDALSYFIANFTYIEINSITYLLTLRTGNTYYINTTNTFTDTYSVLIVTTLIIPSVVNNTTLVLYEYQLDPPFIDTGYKPIENNVIVPLEFKISPTDTNIISPAYIYSYGDNKLVFYYTHGDNITYDLINYNSPIIHYKRINQDICNKIIIVTKLEEYKYYIVGIYNICSNTVCYVYDSTDNIFVTEKFTPSNLNATKKSSEMYQLDNNTYFTLGFKIANLSITGFIQKNEWSFLATQYSYSNNQFIITFPSDFVLLSSSNIYYSLSNILVSINDFIVSNNKLIIIINGLITGGTIKFCQYFHNSIGSVFKPLLNQKHILQFEYPYQYSSSTNFYYIPYSSSGNKFDQYLYLVEINSDTTVVPLGFAQSVANSTLTLINNGNRIVTKIFDLLYKGIGGIYKTYYIVSSNVVIVNNTYTYYLDSKYEINNVLSVAKYQNTFQYAEFYKQIKLNEIYLFMNEEINQYNIINTGASIPSSKFYLVSYNKLSLTNLFYNGKFIQNEQMKKKTSTTTTTIQDIVIPEFNNYTKFFSNISMYFNDQLIEELNENIFNIDKYLYSTEEKRNQLYHLCKIRFIDNKWVLYIPLIFWYANNPGLAIPTIAMPHIEIRLQYTLNPLLYILSNDLSNTTYEFTKIPEVKCTLITEYILLDTIERKLFGTYSHEYVIERYKTFPIIYVNKTNVVLNKKFHGLIKDIYMITNPINDDKTYYSNIITKYDTRYAQYMNAYKYYLEYIKNNIYTSEEQKKYAIDIEIIKNNMISINKYFATENKISSPEIIQINRIINTYNKWAIWDNNLLKYILYFENKYLTALTDSQKETTLSLYLRYMFSNKVIINEISPIDSMVFRANGTDLFAERDYSYFTNVVPYQKFNNSLPTGYYVYTFSLYPLDKQYSGHLNFTNFDDIVIKITSNPLVLSEQYKLSTIVKEYNILRVMSGLASLAWI